MKLSGELKTENSKSSKFYAMALHFAFAVGLEFGKTQEEALSLIQIRVLKSPMFGFASARSL